MRPHKFKAVQNGDCYWAIYCEWCGHVAFNGTKIHSNIYTQKTAREVCPRSGPMSDQKGGAA